jgi:hypothetical protein
MQSRETRETGDPQAPPVTTPTIVPVSTWHGDLIVSIEYDPAGAWCDMWDNQVLSWLIDQTGTVDPVPQTVGSLPPLATGPGVNPQWVHLRGRAAIVPNLWRGSIDNLWGWLSTGGASAPRQLRGNFLDSVPMNSFHRWAAANPELVWPGPGS